MALGPDAMTIGRLFVRDYPREQTPTVMIRKEEKRQD